MTSPAVPGVGVSGGGCWGQSGYGTLSHKLHTCELGWFAGWFHLVFLFCGISSVVFGCMGSAMNAVAPDWTVGSKVLLGLSVYWEMYRRDLEAVFESLAFGKRWPDLWLILIPASQSLKAPLRKAEDIKLNTVGARTQPCLYRWRLGKNLTVHHHQGHGLACPQGTGER